MTRFNPVRDWEIRGSEMSVIELQEFLRFCKDHIKELRGPAVKLANKRIHLIERQLELKVRDEDQT